MNFKKYTKFYKSKANNKNEIAYCSIDYEIVENDNQTYGSISIKAAINYMFVSNNQQKVEKRIPYPNIWELTASNTKCSFNNTIMIEPKYRSFGIGSFLISELIHIAAEKYPEAPLYISLSPVDEYNENKVRRNRLYESIGLIFSPSGESCSITHVKELRLHTSKNLEEIDISNEFDRITSELNIMSEEFNEQNKILMQNKTKSIEYIQKIQSLKTYKTLFYITAIIGCVIFYILKFNG